MKVLVFGATGLVGHALLREWKDDQVMGLGSKDADLRSESEVRRAIEHARPDWIVLSAAYTDVDGCETNRELAFDVNCRGAINVARAAAEYHSRLLFLSTDYVFDGRKTSPYEADDPRTPLSVYGASKAEAEIQLPAILPSVCIVRTSWVFGVGRKCFPDAILKLAAVRSQIEVVSDQRSCPTYSIDLAHAIVHFCRKNAEGVIHATNSGDCTRVELAREIIGRAGLQSEVIPTSSDKLMRPGPRPKYSVLSNASLESRQITMPTWHNALQRYFDERNSS